ncbi:hypothetical protein FPZ12_012795 [Amycolatopsis acidicola]|uniref:Uncharacterized protein n=1 Tax=Amycolatopsis acidicola TaxID=2596893 RepID=A0A5N0V9C2_9PSEU|nr:hypothetical protein [Amycolatopsis acidicola]KAA9162108.1 hypothetical protein FPZ12_012795 [Amycolatopsis acidicola]
MGELARLVAGLLPDKDFARAAAFSIACAAPWARNGSIGWQASPTSVVARVDHRVIGSRS